MPSARIVKAALVKAGFIESETVRSSAGRKARNISGFRVHARPVERKAVHVFHIGRATRSALASYAAALKEADFVVTAQLGGLKVESRRNAEDRRSDAQQTAH